MARLKQKLKPVFGAVAQDRRIMFDHHRAGEAETELVNEKHSSDNTG